MNVVAAFDFDETLTTRDTVVPFLRRFITVPRFAASLLPRSPALTRTAVRRDRDELKELATRIVFADRPVAEVDDAAAEHGRTIAGAWLRADTVARLGWHVDQGHRVVIVSASYESYVSVVARELGPVDVVATRLGVADGRCTGEIRGANCRGPEKLRRLDGWLAREGLARDGVRLYAYGDSKGDRELLGAADHPHWVNEPLATVAPVT